MIKTEISYGNEEYGVLADLIVDSSKEKKGRRIWKIILIVLGALQMVNGVYSLITGSTALCGFCFVTAVGAFFLAFGGERFLVRSAVLRRTKKFNESAGSMSRKFIFDEKGSTIISEEGNSEFTWDAFTSYGEHKHYLWMRRNDNRYVLVDMNKLSEKDAAKLRQYCAYGIKQS